MVDERGSDSDVKYHKRGSSSAGQNRAEITHLCLMQEEGELCSFSGEVDSMAISDFPCHVVSAGHLVFRQPRQKNV